MLAIRQTRQTDMGQLIPAIRQIRGSLHRQSIRQTWAAYTGNQSDRQGAAYTGNQSDRQGAAYTGNQSDMG